MKAWAKLLVSAFIRRFKPCQSCRDGFSTYPRRDDAEHRSQVDLIYCELIEGHAGRHRGMNPQSNEYWHWTGDREPLTSTEEIRDGVAFYDVSQMWQERDEKRGRHKESYGR